MELWMLTGAVILILGVIGFMDKAERDSDAKEEFNFHVDHLKRVNPKETK